MKNPPSIIVTPIAAPMAIEFTKLTFHRMYIRRSRSQEIVMDGKSNLGQRLFCDFPIYDGPGSEAKLVARVQGVAIRTAKIHQIYTIVFEIDRFKGSTLLINGVIEGNSNNEWAIYGGTGEFAMANGVIKRNRYMDGRNDGITDELTMDVFVPVLGGSKGNPGPKDPVTKVGLWGGKGGSAKDVTKPPKRLQSVTIHSGTVIDSIKFTYVDQAGQKHTAGAWGGSGGFAHTIDLVDSEFVKELSGTYGTFRGHNVLTSFKLVTNVKAWGPWGVENGTHFSFSAPTGSSIVGFYGSSGSLLDAIGVYLYTL
ncbi:unnamed protein product [Urochloa humidicola]